MPSKRGWRRRRSRDDGGVCGRGCFTERELPSRAFESQRALSADETAQEKERAGKRERETEKERGEEGIAGLLICAWSVCGVCFSGGVQTRLFPALVFLAPQLPCDLSRSLCLHRGEEDGPCRAPRGESPVAQLRRMVKDNGQDRKKWENTCRADDGPRMKQRYR